MRRGRLPTAAGGPRLGLIAGSSLREAALPEGDWVAAAASRARRRRTCFRTEIDHVANLRALAEAGCDRVLALGSVGGLREELGPGTLVCPDDFIALDAEPVTSLDGPGAHRVPGFDAAWRGEWCAALAAAGAELRDGGVYWQATGPRLETPAEIRLIAAHADVIGMTVASRVRDRRRARAALRGGLHGRQPRQRGRRGELTLEQIEANRAHTGRCSAACWPTSFPR